MLRNWFILFITVIVLISSGGGWLYYSAKHEKHVDQTLQALETVKSVAKVQNKYDVIVVGTDPEGITAAVSAARNGLKTLLVDGRDRTILGGLMTLGWLNSIDMNYDKVNPSIIPGKHNYLNKGLFMEWFDRIEGHSFDVHTAANAFYKMVKNEKNIDLLLDTKEMTPLLKEAVDSKQAIEGIKITKKDGKQHYVYAATIIDATQDADIAFAAGVPFTIGHEDLGDKKAQMAVTLVFKVKNVTPEVWKQVKQRLNEDTDMNTGADETSAWGYSGMRAYQPLNPLLATMRGLNIGRQNDHTLLSNSLLLYHVDPFDANSRKQAIETAQKELPYVVDFMRKTFPEFANVELGDVAPELYVRETRHMIGEYRLNVVDLLENKDQWDRIAFGSYAGDIQPKDSVEKGNVILDPIQYAIPFRSIVPQKVDGLLVVGRSASYDTLAHGSARVIPNGMAEGEAAGVAAKVAKEHNVTFREMSKSKDLIAEMQDMMNKQGMDIKPYKLKNQDYMNHKDYAGLKVAVYLGITNGSYGNKMFDLDGISNSQRVVNSLNVMKRKYPAVFPGSPSAAIAAMTEAEAKLPVSLEQLSYTIIKTMNVQIALKDSLAELIKQKLLTQTTLDWIPNKASLTNGDVFMVIRDLLAYSVDLHFE
ncbi:MAG: FAD-dependent oxidoreductase [Paenibacillaceae bacterium]